MTASSTVVFKKAGLREATVLLALAWAVPFAIHLAPWAGERPLGAFLLPVFWTAFVAVYFYGAAFGLLVGLFAPALNLMVTGLPEGKFLVGMGVEVAVYAAVTAWAVRRVPRLWLVAPVGCVVAKALVAAGTTAVALGGFDWPAGSLAGSLIGGLAGLSVLAVINAALVRVYPKDTTAGK